MCIHSSKSNVYYMIYVRVGIVLNQPLIPTLRFIRPQNAHASNNRLTRDKTIMATHLCARFAFGINVIIISSNTNDKRHSDYICQPRAPDVIDESESLANASKLASK